MKKTILFTLFITITALFLAACWNPRGKEVAITAPWDKMNLPVKENARIYGSDDKNLRVYHKEKFHVIAERYINALGQDGWEITGKQSEDWRYIFDFKKNDQKFRALISEDYESRSIFTTTTVNLYKP
jgi:hypothetical protein